MPIAPARWAALGLAALTLTGTAVVGAPVTSAAATSCTISGTAYADADADASRDASEAPREADTLYLYTAGGSYVSLARTTATGDYAFAPVACGTYTVSYAAASWWKVRGALVPSTTGTIWPRQQVTGSARADFGWRPIARSTTAGAPLSAFTGPEGLRVESYNDVVPARAIYDEVVRGSTGPEAASVTVRLDLGTTSATTSTAVRTDGAFSRVTSIVTLGWLAWLDDAPNVTAHEYGHAWATHRAYLVQQDPALTGYLAARGIAADDPRLETSHGWSRGEMVAEDYRQLLGSAPAAAAAQENRDLPPAADVPGLRDYLVGAFSAAPTAPEPSPSPTSEPSPSPTATLAPSPSPSPSPSTTPTASPTASPSPSPTTSPRTKSTCRKRC